jgi:hypothetical protein
VHGTRSSVRVLMNIEGMRCNTESTCVGVRVNGMRLGTGVRGGA